MRFDKFTLKVQEAIQEAQASGRSARSPGARRGASVRLASETAGGHRLRNHQKARRRSPPHRRQRSRRPWRRLPKIEGAAGGQTYMTPRLNQLLDAAMSEAARLTDEYVSAEHVLVAMADEKDGRCGKDPPRKRHHEGCDLQGPRGDPGKSADHRSQSGGEVPGAETVCPRFQRTGPERFLRSRDRPGRRDQEDHAGPLPADEEQSRS